MPLLTLLSCSIVLALISCGKLRAQIVPGDVTAAERTILFNEIDLRLHDSSHLDGRLVGIVGDSLVYLRTGKAHRIDIGDLSRVAITGEENLNAGAHYGIVLGVYGMNVLFDYVSPQGIGTFRDNDLSAFAAMNALYFFLGVTGGYISELRLRSDPPAEQFRLQGTPEEQAWEMERMRQHLAGGRMARRWHLTAAGSPVHTEFSLDRRNEMVAQGWRYDRQFAVHEDERQISTVDFLRELRLTWSLDERVELGAAIEFLSERPIFARRANVSISQWMYGNGLFALGRYSINVDRGGWLVAGVTAGAGGFLYDWRRLVRTQLNTVQTAEETAGGFLPAGLLSAGADIFLHDGLSVGLFTDYQLLASRRSPALEDAGVPEQIYFGSNWSLGFNVGLHF